MRRFVVGALLLTVLGASCASQKPMAPGEPPPLDPAVVQKAEAYRAKGMRLLYSKDPAVKDPAGAYEKFQAAAAMGDPVSMDVLGGYHSAGLAGVEKSCAKALEWFEKSASAGYPIAMNNLAYTLVSCPDRKLRNADKAEALVKFLFQANGNLLTLLDTYAAVQAEQGHFAEAANMMEAVVDLASFTQANPERVDSMRKALGLYRQKKRLGEGYRAEPHIFQKTPKTPSAR